MSSSDNGGALATQSSPLKSNAFTKGKPTLLYSQATERSMFPKKDQAIITDSVEGLQIKDYVLAIGGLVGPENIRFASRISQGRVCLYLSNRELADNVTAKDTTINIGTHSLTLRPLISKSKRIIISNVCPIIPHSVLLNKLLEYEIKPISQISFLKAGINEPNYSHIMSFRRQMYIHSDDVSKVPESIQINFDDTTYWVYLSSDKLSCFLCKEEGHLANHCRNLSQNKDVDAITENQPDLESVPPHSDQSVLQDTYSEAPLSQDQLNLTPALFPETTDKLNSQPLSLEQKSTNQLNSGFKRPLSVSSQASSTNTQKRQTKAGLSAIHKRKKQEIKQCSITEIDTQLEAAKEYLSQNSNTYPINLENFKDFLLSSYGVTNLLELAKTYTENTNGLIMMLDDAYGHVNNRTLKSRITRIKKKLSNPKENDPIYDSTSASEESTDDFERSLQL